MDQIEFWLQYLKCALGKIACLVSSSHQTSVVNVDRFNSCAVTKAACLSGALLFCGSKDGVNTGARKAAWGLIYAPP